jgi:hypothetical protein
MPFSASEKRLRIGLTYSSAADLPPNSEGHQKHHEAIYSAAAKAGYEAMQGGDAHLCKVMQSSAERIQQRLLALQDLFSRLRN